MRSVMKFVHRRCWDILASIDALLNSEENTRGNGNSENMSLLDKMALWAVKDLESSDMAPQIESADQLFEGVSEEDEEDFELAEISSYRALIVESPPYHWLISALQHEMFISATEAHSPPGTKHGSIRDDILDKLPPGLLSRRAPPLLYEMTFDVSWNPFQTPCRAWLRDNCTTITGDFQSCVAETAADFIRQRWPLSENRLFPMMQKLVSAGMELNATVSDTAHDDTRLLAWVENGTLKCSITGPAYTVAEYGEQLGWLSAAFQSSPFQHVALCTPLVRDISVASTPSSIQGVTGTYLPPRKASCVIDFKFDEPGRAQHNGPEEWHSLLRRRVIVKGLPLHPQAPVLGLNAALDQLCDLTGDGYVELTSHCILLRGSGGLLTLEGFNGEYYLWRILYDPSMTFRQGRIDADNPLWGQVRSNSFAKSRHILLSQSGTGNAPGQCLALLVRLLTQR
ncbi:hypothetical protein B0T16DRAFT_170686 [Cercophora newfieldiana]|uniref:Uncharacterized protein n=1 Tax=Cercophora newfieldiana TaxID=92897 RepID=A0AA39Y6Z0_9PEZI|nr:hypothetical protein B0T16DRAFT_170686 [Cercophora newfieldiana]